MKKIMLHEPFFFKNEKNYLKKCISTKWVSTGGEFVTKFENEVKKFTNAKFAVALNSGTSAIDLSLKLLGISGEDEVMVPTITFIAPVNCILYQKANPIFFDCDKNLNIDADKVINFIEKKNDF